MAAGHLPDFIKYNLQHGKNGLYAPVFPGKIFWSSQSPEDPEAQLLSFRRVIGVRGRPNRQVLGQLPV